MSQRAWWRRGSLRTRLLVASAPVSLLLVVVLLKLWTVVVAGGSAPADFAARDADALRGDVSTLSIADVVEPTRTRFAAGTLAVLEDRLTDADGQFALVLAGTDAAASCPVRVNLELVRETLGDRAAETFDGAAVGWYRNALAVVDAAPAGCFTGSTDADPDRRAVLEATAARLNAKIDAVSVAPPPPPPPPPPAAPPPPPPPAASGPGPDEPDQRLRLNPGAGDPLDRLQQILRDAAAAQNGG
ncbi:hypothetical protein H7J06_21215 [Mycobacterium hodleri]|uniref:hypothetical protein n=1 Tax=Mycolicibacterium hodleri TaxID=49897 RepID=UPI0021F30E02|nr:hypothetical protein [Mycolicibacterium hodleri]MCV7135500.1 hypothetical protein [Mycolicibacterium hodleri]